MSKMPWAVCFKGDDDGTSIEYSVVRIDNDHGFKSYGWAESDRKEIITTDGGPCRYTFSPMLMQMQQMVAVKYAQYLNRKEGNGDFDVMWYENRQREENLLESHVEEINLLSRLRELTAGNSRTTPEAVRDLMVSVILKDDVDDNNSV